MSRTVQLYEPAGPIQRKRHRLYTVVFCVILAFTLWAIVERLAAADQFTADKWAPFLRSDVWVNVLLPGLGATLKLALAASVIALVLGTLFGVGRLSMHRWVSWPCAAVVEFGRSVPLLMLIFFAQVGSYALLGFTVLPFEAVLFGLVVYNGAVLAEVVRAGVRSLPKGQEEAAMALGLRRTGRMIHVLLPQTFRAMLPLIIVQLVTLLKDTALGYIVSYPELLRGSQLIGAQYSNIIPAAIVVAAIYIAINMALGGIATRLQQGRRHKKSDIYEQPTANLELATR